MKAGVVYPQIELGGDTGAVKAFAQAAEELGYDSVWFSEHHTSGYSFGNPCVIAAAAAQRTKRIRGLLGCVAPIFRRGVPGEGDGLIQRHAPLVIEQRCASLCAWDAEMPGLRRPTIW